MKLDDFLRTHPLFTIPEVERYVAEQGKNPAAVRSWMLSYYRRKGRIIPVRRGLYAAIPPGSSPDEFAIDPFLIASHQRPDAVIAYQTALQFYGIACWTTPTFYACSRSALTPLEFGGYVFRLIQPPSTLRRKNRDHAEVRTVLHAGTRIRVTSIERTICDAATRPALCGGWKNVLCALDKIQSVDVPRILKYLKVLNNRTTAAKMGYILSKFRERWGVTPEHLDALIPLCPKQPHYIERSKRGNGHMFGKFNLVIPAWMLNWTPSA